MCDLFPMVPLANRQALGIAIMSYHGQINFGLLADYDALPDLDDLATDLAESIEELAVAAGVPTTGPATPAPAPARSAPAASQA
jgi:hypothetical protein